MHPVAMVDLELAVGPLVMETLRTFHPTLDLEMQVVAVVDRVVVVNSEVAALVDLQAMELPLEPLDLMLVD